MIPALLLAALAGCGLEDWRNADLQLEIEGASLDTRTLTRVCVSGLGARTGALKDGRLAYPGLPAEGAVELTVDALQAEDTGGDAVRIGRAGPVVFEAQTRLTVAWSPCEGDCPPCRESAAPAEEEPTRLLAVRFLGLER